MPPTLPSPAELADWLRQLEDGCLSVDVSRRLLHAVATLGTALETAQRDAHALAAVQLGLRLSARPISGRCPTCGDAEAHTAAAWLRKAAGVATAAGVAPASER